MKFVRILPLLAVLLCLSVFSGAKADPGFVSNPSCAYTDCTVASLKVIGVTQLQAGTTGAPSLNFGTSTVGIGMPVAGCVSIMAVVGEVGRFCQSLTSLTAVNASTSLVIGAGSAITSSGPGGALGSNAFTSTAYAPLASPTFTGTVTIPSGAAFATPASGVITNLTGTCAACTANTVTTNANLTGVITSVGNATSIASQTGTGSKFVVDTAPTLVTPIIGVASGTSLALGGASIGTNALAVTGAADIKNGSNEIQLLATGNIIGGGGSGSFDLKAGSWTNGNVTITPISTGATYLSFGSGTGGVIFGNGAAGVVGSVNASGNAIFNGTATISTIATGTGDFICAPIGGGLISQGVTTCVASDRRVKNDLGTITPEKAVARIMALPDEHRFTYKDGYGASGDHTGWFAQDIQKIWPGVVYKTAKTKLTPDGELSFDKGEIGPDTTTAVKWLILQERIDRAEIVTLKRQLHYTGHVKG